MCKGTVQKVEAGSEAEPVQSGQVVRVGREMLASRGLGGLLGLTSRPQVGAGIIRETAASLTSGAGCVSTFLEGVLGFLAET